MPVQRMFVARDHNEFNAAVNRMAGTTAVEYSPPWHMSTASGRQYMAQNYQDVGRKLACAALSSSSLAGSRMQSSHVSTDPSPQQKAALHALAQSKTEEQFQDALKLAVKNHALRNSVLTALRRPTAGGVTYIPYAPRYAAVPASEQHSADTVMLDAPSASAASPLREATTMLEPSAASPPLESVAMHGESVASPLRLAAVLPREQGAAKVAPRKKVRRKA